MLRLLDQSRQIPGPDRLRCGFGAGGRRRRQGTPSGHRFPRSGADPRFRQLVLHDGAISRRISCPDGAVAPRGRKRQRCCAMPGGEIALPQKGKMHTGKCKSDEAIAAKRRFGNCDF